MPAVRRLILILLILLIVVRGGTLALDPGSEDGRVQRIVDGDTLVVRVDGREESVRLLGIDTPERSPAECGSVAATNALAELADGRRVELVPDATQDERDRYGRLLAYVEAGGNDVGEALVRRGWAEVYVFDEPFARLDEYREAAAEAESAGRGLFGRCS